MIFLVCCIVSLFNYVFILSPGLHNIFHTPIAGYSLFVLKVLLNTNKPNQTIWWRLNDDDDDDDDVRAGS